MRARQLDGLRAAAALAVVLIHVSAGRTSAVGILCNQLARFAVPLFIMISGFGHMSSELRGAGAPHSAAQTAARRLARILPPYLVWSGIYLAVEAVFGRPHPHPVRDILTGNSYVHLYYMFILAQLVVLSVPLCRAVLRHPRVTLPVCAAATFGMELVLWKLAGGLWQWHFPIAPICLFVSWLLYYAGGAWLAKSGLSAHFRLRYALPLWCAAAVLVLKAAQRSAAAAGIVLRPDLTVYTLLTWAVLWALAGRREELPAPVRFIARHSFGLYLSHPLVLRLWNEWTTRQAHVTYLRMWQMFALAFIGGLAISVALSVLPFGKWLGGAENRKNILQRRA